MMIDEVTAKIFVSFGHYLFTVGHDKNSKMVKVPGLRADGSFS